MPRARDSAIGEQTALVDVRFVGIEECASVEHLDVAVVIDVLRAFSFAAYALDAGVERMILMDDVDAALELARTIPGALAGKDGPPQAGFALLNSPGQLLERTDLHGRTLVHRTAAGTVGAVAARRARHLLCSSFVVAAATVDRIRALEPESVTFVITGDGGHAPEDLACAEYLAATLANGSAPDARSYLAEVDAAGQDLIRAVELGHRGVHRDDLALCMDVDRFDFALVVDDEDGHLVLRDS
jgi:2-phosphosulfolactate phosphatase